jgi:hypothetical protein
VVMYKGETSRSTTVLQALYSQQHSFLVSFCISHCILYPVPALFFAITTCISRFSQQLHWPSGRLWPRRPISTPSPRLRKVQLQFRLESLTQLSGRKPNAPSSHFSFSLAPSRPLWRFKPPQLQVSKFTVPLKNAC